MYPPRPNEGAIQPTRLSLGAMNPLLTCIVSIERDIGYANQSI